MDDALRRLEWVVPSGRAFVLVDQDEWATPETLRGRRRFLFLDENGVYWGLPTDDAMAIRELERLRALGAEFIVFVWPYLWWLEYYRGLTRHLRGHYRVCVEDDRLVIFDLRQRRGRWERV
jgi:hypothetical protein